MPLPKLHFEDRLPESAVYTACGYVTGSTVCRIQSPVRSIALRETKKKEGWPPVNTFDETGTFRVATLGIK